MMPCLAPFLPGWPLYRLLRFGRRPNINGHRNEGKTKITADTVAEIGNVRVAHRVGTGSEKNEPDGICLFLNGISDFESGAGS
jgi:hypothetical protein